MYASDLKHSDLSLEDKLNRLYRLGRDKTIDLSFRPAYLELLRKFGNPHLHLPPVIHVAGTNGKGSVIATLKAILESRGCRVHAYTSPHLCHFNERLYLAGQNISDSTLHDLIDEALTLNESNDITFFEITTAMAFAAFARHKADIVLLETGLGGRLDCTNIIENPAATIITNIGYDHMDFLGDSLEQIAFEKSGIMKKNAPCVIGRQKHDIVIPVFEKIARQKNVPLMRFAKEWSSALRQGRLHFLYQNKEIILPAPALLGAHQIYNAGAALAALQILQTRFDVSRHHMAQGLRNIHWPARLQNLTRCFESSLSSNWEVWLDGGHNADAAQELALQAQTWHEADGKPLHLVIGMLQSKTPEDFIKPLKNHLQSIYAVNIENEPKSFNSLILKDRLEKECGHGRVLASASHETAIKTIACGDPAAVPGRILITGSLYLAGHVLKYAGL